MELKIGPGRWGEALDEFFYRTVSRVADSTGKVYELYDPGRGGTDLWLFKSTHPWGELAPLGQRALLVLWSVPEDADWVDITFGRGEKAGTLRVELSEVDG